jgi:hypothetical protein
MCLWRKRMTETEETGRDGANFLWMERRSCVNRSLRTARAGAGAPALVVILQGK